MNCHDDYTVVLQQNKRRIQSKLDELIRKHAVTVVGNGYVDIIVLRENHNEFLKGLSSLGVIVECLSWWCRVKNEKSIEHGCPHGYGGPVTECGFFSEMCHEFDEVDKSAIVRLEKKYTSENIDWINKAVMKIIRGKRTNSHSDGTRLEYHVNECLTPGFWIRVPEDWRHEQAEAIEGENE